MRRKKNFVLLEIIIAFALVSISILPFLRYPYRHMRQELDMLFQMQLTRHAQERLCEIEQNICTMVEPEDLMGTKKKTHRLKSIKQNVSLPNGWVRQYDEHLQFEATAQRSDEKFHYSLVHIHLSYHRKDEKPTKFHTELILIAKKNV